MGAVRKTQREEVRKTQRDQQSHVQLLLWPHLRLRRLQETGLMEEEVGGDLPGSQPLGTVPALQQQWSSVGTGPEEGALPAWALLQQSPAAGAFILLSLCHADEAECPTPTVDQTEKRIWFQLHMPVLWSPPSCPLAPTAISSILQVKTLRLPMLPKVILCFPDPLAVRAQNRRGFCQSGGRGRPFPTPPRSGNNKEDSLGDMEGCGRRCGPMRDRSWGCKRGAQPA